jgi:outer membrane protein assembly factor BamB
MTKNKTATLIALFMIVAMTVSLIALPTVNAHDPAWEIPTTAYLNVAPDPVGVGQTVFVVVWLDRTLAQARANNDIRMKNYKLTVTAPDKSTDVVTWPEITDTTSSAYTLYTPDQVGEYTFKFEFTGFTYTWEDNYENDTFLPSSRTMTITVQEEPLPEAKTSYPLPTEYWTRPIEGENTDWWTIASNWLGSGCPKFSGYLRKVQPDGIAPNSAHVMWTRPVDDGGVVGGTNVGIDGNVYYMGLTYNRRFTNRIIMNGRLYYELAYGNSGSGGGWICVDLRTGEEIWYNPEIGASGTGLSDPSFGYLFDYNDPNQHGVLPQGLLFTSRFSRAYVPSTGVPTSTNVTNVPRGTSVLGPSGEHITYEFDYRNGWLAQWNSSYINYVSEGQIGARNWYPGEVDASDDRFYDWNVSLPDLTGSANPSVVAGAYNDMLFGRSCSLLGSLTPSSWGTPDPMTYWAISVKEGQEGRLLWKKDITPPVDPETYTLLQGPVDFDAGVFTFWCKETLQYYAYSLADGSKLWGPTERTLSDFDYYEPETTAMTFEGKLYYANYGGILYCWDLMNGSLLWTYGNGGEGNTTNTGFGTSWGHWPIQPEIACDGKLYLSSTEHSPNTPLYKDSRFRCINASTGEEMWTLLNYGGTYGGFGPEAAIADGYLVTLNQYDYLIYCIGKGPSDITVTASPKVSVHGSSVLVEGSVYDIAAGTKQAEQAARFPKGVPAVSDESMGAWMEYVYMQKPKPTDVTGVPVTITVFDPNGNLYDVGTTTSDENGMFKLMFTPEVPGEYTVIANFAGSESFWPSHAATAIGVEEAPVATPEPTPTPAPMTDTYVLGIGAGAIVAIIVVGLLLMLMLRKR